MLIAKRFPPPSPSAGLPQNRHCRGSLRCVLQWGTLRCQAVAAAYTANVLDVATKRGVPIPRTQDHLYLREFASCLEPVALT